MVKRIKKQIMAYGKKPAPFSMRSPLNNTPEDGDKKTKKSIPYYSASSNVLSFDQNNRLEKIFRDPNQKGKVFKTNDGNYYPSDRFTSNKDNTGVTLNKGYSYGEGGLLSSAAKGTENPKGNLVSRNAGVQDKNLASNKINPFAGTNNSGTAGVSGYRTGSMASNPEGKKLGEDVPMGKNPFTNSGGESKPSSFLSGFGIFPSRETSVMGSTSISQSKDSKITPNKKGSYLDNSFDSNTSTNGNPAGTNSTTGFKTFPDKKSGGSTGASVNASSLIPSGGFGGGNLSTSGRPNFSAVNTMLSNATNDKNKKNNAPVSKTSNTSTSNDRNIKPISASDDFKKQNASNISKTSNIVSKAISSEDNNIPSYAPRSRRDKIIDRQNRKTDRTVERVGNSIERIKGRQQRSGVREAGRDIRRSDVVKNESYNQTMKSAVAGAKNTTPSTKPNPSTVKNNATSTKPAASLPANPGNTSGSVAPGPAVNVSKSNSLSFNLSSSVPKQKLRTNAATPVSASSKTPGLRGLEQKNQKSVNKSSKNATKKAIKDNKRSTKSLTATAMGGNNNDVTDRMPGGKKSKTFGI